MKTRSLSINSERDYGDDEEEEEEKSKGGKKKDKAPIPDSSLQPELQVRYSYFSVSGPANRLTGILQPDFLHKVRSFDYAAVRNYH